MLQVGTRLGPYEILAPIGAGGMGEVYRAKDTRLDRTVAIKIIPSHLSNNSDLKQRFEREARTISSLNHPNICALYDIGNQDGIDFLVMEFLDGETLAERLTKGSLPLEQVFRYGIEIADALDKAHKQGIIHRDLKPGNIMLTKSGIKLLDFGLAKLHAAAAPLLSGVSALPTEHHDLTAEGTILGTIQYMSPEQLEAKETDARTDIFAFGTILYEMATGKRVFSGKSQAGLIAAILSSDPAPISTIQPVSPPAFDRIVKTCLAKDPEDRWQTAHDVMLELKWVAEERTSGQTTITHPIIHKWRERVAWGAACIFLITTLLLSLLHFRNNVPQPKLYRLSINPPEGFSFSFSLALSPDGQHLAFTAMDADGTNSLWIRKLDSLSSHRLPGTDNAVFPFWSPDGRSVGFFADSKLKRIEIAGGPPVVLAEATNDPRGGTWNRSDEILFSPTFQGPIYRISASGGKATPVTTLNNERLEGSHRWPLFLPDGQHFFYLMTGGKGESGSIYVGSVQGENPRLLMKVNSAPAFAPPENLLFVREQTLMVQRFDPKTFALKGSATPIAEQLAIHPDMAGFAAFSVSDNGVLAYRSESNISRLILVDRSKRILKEVGAPGYYFAQSFSPDSTRVAVTIQDIQTHNGDIWIFDLIRGVPTRLTFNPADDQTPFWSPDGKQIVFCSDRAGGTMSLFLQNADSTKGEKLLFKSEVLNQPSDWSSDGKFILYNRLDPINKFDVWVFPLFGDRVPFAFLSTPFGEWGARFSPDVHWIAYTSNETGRAQVYIRPFPGPGKALQVSVQGGKTPRWRKDGKELFFLALDGKIMSVQLNLGTPMHSSPPVALFEAGKSIYTDNQYDVSSDGERFLINRTLDSKNSASVTVVLNWLSDNRLSAGKSQ